MSNQQKLDYITVETLFHENEKRLKLQLITGKGSFRKKIVEKELHRPGLALAGFTELFTFHRVQICGNTEGLYLSKLNRKDRFKSLKKVFSFDIPCFIVTSEKDIVPEFLEVATEYGVSVFRTPYETTKLIQLLGEYLDEKFAPRIYVHGSMVDVYGIGVLIAGRSGIGKSEVALDLVARGHRLIADDVVTICHRAGGALFGMVNETLQHHMEIRGLGIIDIHAIFGIRGIRKLKRLEVQVELVDWDASQKYDRLGIDEMTTEILGEKVPLIRLPIYPGKNISMIVEVMALNQLLKLYGYNAAQTFDAQLIDKISQKSQSKQNLMDHLLE
ncbi:HPr kinase/phosphorylase [bacterium]|nr:HPr kinase/phosphorylase [bacterium]